MNLNSRLMRLNLVPQLLFSVGILSLLSLNLFSQVIRTLSSRSDMIADLAFSNDGKYVAVGGTEKSIEIWDVTSSEKIDEFKKVDHSVSKLLFSPDDKYIVSASATTGGWTTSSKLIVFDWESSVVINKISIAPYVNTLSFNDDGSLIVVGAIDKIQVYSIERGDKVSEIKIKNIFSFAEFYKENIVSFLIPYNKVGNQFIPQPNNFTVNSFNSITGSELNSFVTADYWEAIVKVFEMIDTNIKNVPSQSDLFGVYKAKNANLLFIVKTGNIIDIWDFAEGIKLGTLQKGFSVFRMAIENSGRYIATAGENNLISIWDLSSMPEVAAKIGPK